MKKARATKQAPEPAVWIENRTRLGWALINAGRPSEAIPLFWKTTRESESRLGSSNSETLYCLASLGCAELAAGLGEDALPKLEMAFQERRKVLAPEDENLLASLNELAEGYTASHQWTKAEKLRRDLLQRRRRQNPPREDHLADASARLGRLLILTGHPAEAEAPIREALTIRERISPNQWSHFVARTLLGTSLLDQGRPSEAEPLLVGGLVGMASRASDTSYFTRLFDELPDASSRVDRLFRSLGRPEEAGALRTKLRLPMTLPADVFAY